MIDEIDETVEILHAYLVEHGIDAADMECSKSRISIQTINTTSHKNAWTWKIMDIIVEGPNIICKSDIWAPGAGNDPTKLDLHYPDSLYRLLGVIHDIQEAAQKHSPIDKIIGAIWHLLPPKLRG